MINVSKLQDSLQNHPRYAHSVGVMTMALKLNQLHHLNVEPDDIKLAALLHDIAKPYEPSQSLHILETFYTKLLSPEEYEMILKFPAIWHAYVGAIVIQQEYGIENMNVIEAIKYHTTGRAQMSNLEKLIFLSDYIEEGRKGAHFEEARKTAYLDIDQAIIKMYEYEFAYLKGNNNEICPLGLSAYRYYKGERMIKDLIKILDKAVVNDVVVYDTTMYTPYYDYVIIGSVNTARQGNAAVGYLRKEAPALGIDVRSFTSGNDATWFLIDINNVVIHIFVQEERKRYNLDGMYEQLSSVKVVK